MVNCITRHRKARRI
nr:unnamed protein product [Callosobruchus chinensis]